MNDTVLNTIAFALMAFSLPLVSYGSTNEIAALWGVGFVILAVGVLIPPVLRYTDVEAANA